jgi:hypothetical protein
MLPLLALSVVAQTDAPLPIFHSYLEVAKLLSSMGYSFKATGEKSVSGDISQGKAIASVSMARTVGDPAKGTKDTIPFIDLDIEFAARKPISFEDADAWTKAHSSKSGVTFTPHLGDTVTESLQINLQKITLKDLKLTLADFFTVGKSFANAWGTDFVALKASDEKRIYDDKIVLDRADYISFERVTTSWGWKSDQLFGYVTQGWIFPIKVNGKMLWIRQATKGVDALPTAIEIVRYADTVAPADFWKKAQAAGDLMPSAMYDDRGTHVAEARVSIDLSKGVSLGEIRRKVAAF